MDTKAIAVEILNQLGGNRFIAMTGASNFCCGENLFTCKIMRNQSGANYLRIKLNSLDLYDMEFIRIHGNTTKVVAEKNGIYDDMLQSVFTSVTGLYTHL